MPLSQRSQSHPKSRSTKRILEYLSHSYPKFQEGEKIEAKARLSVFDEFFLVLEAFGEDKEDLEKMTTHWDTAEARNKLLDALSHEKCEKVKRLRGRAVNPNLKYARRFFYKLSFRDTDK